MTSDTPSVSTASFRVHLQPASHAGAPLSERLALVTILAIATLLDFYHIDQNGFGNTYYATTVHSMSLSWHNWFFASFDPGGFVTVDKPPLGFWIQLASVWLFGFHGVALILPQAIAGVLSVGVLYRIVRSVFGGPAALISACLLALSPINVVSNRDNTLDSQVVLLMLLAALAVTKALEDGTLRWLMVGGVCIGLGFNIKMLEAYLVVPSLAAAYVLAAPLPWRARILHLLTAGAIMTLVSFAWMVAVDLTPAASRPYVGSSPENSEWSLVLTYNGLQRLTGSSWALTPQPSGSTGMPGPFRLFTSQMASQVAWLLPLALICLVALLIQSWRTIQTDRRKRRVTPEEGAVMLWGVWFITMFTFFSAAVFLNLHYLTMLAPAIAALVGIGLSTLWTAKRARRWQGWLLLLGVVGTVVEQDIILSQSQGWDAQILSVTILLFAFLVSGLLVVTLIRAFSDRTTRALNIMTAGALAITLGLAPVLWTCSSLHPDRLSGAPVSGPLYSGPGPVAAPAAPPPLLAYLRQHAAGATFLVATVTASEAVPIIFSTGAPVMALGGYTGHDPILTPATLAEKVAANQIRLFYLPSSNLTEQQARQVYPNVPDPANRYTNRLTRWVAQQCLAVPPEQWSTTNGALTTHMSPMQIFDCSALVRS